MCRQVIVSRAGDTAHGMMFRDRRSGTADEDAVPMSGTPGSGELMYTISFYIYCAVHYIYIKSVKIVVFGHIIMARCV